MLHIRLIDSILVGMCHTADNAGYDLDNDRDYIDFVSVMTNMEFDGIESFSVDFINRLLPIQARIDEALRVKRERSRVMNK